MKWPPADPLKYLSSSSAQAKLKVVRAAVKALGVPGVSSDDVVQETVFKTLKGFATGRVQLGQFGSEEGFWRYEWCLARSASIDEWRWLQTRRKAVRRKAALEPTEPASVPCELELDTKDFLDWLKNSLSDEEERWLFSLMRTGKSDREILAALPNVRSHSGLRAKKLRLFDKLRTHIARSTK